MKRIGFFRRPNQAFNSGLLGPLAGFLLILLFSGLASGFASIKPGDSDSLIGKTTPTALSAASTRSTKHCGGMQESN